MNASKGETMREVIERHRARMIRIFNEERTMDRVTANLMWMGIACLFMGTFTVLMLGIDHPYVLTNFAISLIPGLGLPALSIYLSWWWIRESKNKMAEEVPR